jgi:hypothetical protein
MSDLHALHLVDDVVAAVVSLRPELEPIPGSATGHVRFSVRGELMVRIFSLDPEVDVRFQVESWERGLVGEAAFSNMPADVIAAAIVSALELQF